MYMFETHPLSFAGKFVFWISKKMDLTITTLRKRTKFLLRLFLWKTKIRMKIQKYLEKCVFKKLPWKLLRNSLFRRERQTKYRQFIISNSSKMKIRKGREIRYLREYFPQKYIFFENPIRKILFEKRTVLKTYELRFNENEFLKTFLAQLRDF